MPSGSAVLTAKVSSPRFSVRKLTEASPTPGSIHQGEPGRLTSRTKESGTFSRKNRSASSSRRAESGSGSSRTGASTRCRSAGWIRANTVRTFSTISSWPENWRSWSRSAGGLGETRTVPSPTKTSAVGPMVGGDMKSVPRSMRSSKSGSRSASPWAWNPAGSMDR